VLHQHQREAIEAARTGKSYVLTTGPGSGKSPCHFNGGNSGNDLLVWHRDCR
jgi:hypothetical protein